MNLVKIFSYLLVGITCLQFASAAKADEAECIKLAAYPEEGGSGVADDTFDALNALVACKPVADASPDNAELSMLTARAYIALNKGKEAYEYLGKAANKGSWRAQFTLYDWATRNPPVINIPDETKTSLLAAAAQSGPPSVALILVKNLVEGRFTEKDIPKAAELAKAVAEKGSATAMRFYAEMIAQGVVPNVDKKEAVAWFEKAANAGDKPAMFILGRILERQRDKLREGLRWINKSADEGHVPAQKYIIGGFSKLNPAGKQQALEKYVELGSVYAMDELGRMLAGRKLVRSERKLGYEYLEKAFELGNASSGWTLLGEFYRLKRTADIKKWEDKLWPIDGLKSRRSIINHYRQKGKPEQFLEKLAKLAADTEVNGLGDATLLLLTLRDKDIERYWKETAKYMSRYLKEGGEEAKTNVAKWLMIQFDLRADHYIKYKNRKVKRRTGTSKFHGPVSKAMYDQLVDIFLTGKQIPDDLRTAFVEKRERYKTAAEQAMSNYRIIVKRIDEQAKFQQFLKSGHAGRCGKMPAAPQKALNKAEADQFNKSINDWRTCLRAQFSNVDDRYTAVKNYSWYKEIKYGFISTELVEFGTDKRIKEFKKSINTALETMEKRIEAHNKRFGKN